MADTSDPHPAPPVVERPDQLTPGWFSHVLASDGSPAVVDRVTAEEVGTGQMSVTLRVRLEADGGASRTVITKLARPEIAAGPLARAAYAKEIAFYTELAPRLPVRTPGCHHAAIADDGSSFTLVLDDLAESRPGDQIEGCPVPAAEAAVANLAALHGPTWCDEEIAGRPWLSGDPSLTADALAPVLEMAADQFGDRFAAELTVGNARCSTRRAASWRTGWSHRRPPSPSFTATTGSTISCSRPTIPGRSRPWTGRRSQSPSPVGTSPTSSAHACRSTTAAAMSTTSSPDTTGT